jgi:hypothetical protein
MGQPQVDRRRREGGLQALWMDIAKDIEPSNVIEWLRITDILELSWEIRRLRHIKREVMCRSFITVIGDDFENGLVHYKKLDVLAVKV